MKTDSHGTDLKRTAACAIELGTGQYNSIMKRHTPNSCFENHIRELFC
jgi:hypothetical protein